MEMCQLLKSFELKSKFHYFRLIQQTYYIGDYKEAARLFRRMEPEEKVIFYDWAYSQDVKDFAFRVAVNPKLFK